MLDHTHMLIRFADTVEPLQAPDVFDSPETKLLTRTQEGEGP